MKQKPQFEFEDLGDFLQVVFHVDEEESSKTIDLDISEQELKLSSPQ